MPKRKKDVTKMTTDELEHHLFPKKVVNEIKRIAHEYDEKTEPKSPKKHLS